MEIKFPERRCELSPNANHAHFFTPLIGTIWRCKYCWVTMWLPATWEDTVAFSDDIAKMGMENAYQKHLEDKPIIRRTLRKLEDVRLLRKAELPEKELMIAIAAIMTGGEE